MNYICDWLYRLTGRAVQISTCCQFMYRFLVCLLLLKTLTLTGGNPVGFSFYDKAREHYMHEVVRIHSSAPGDKTIDSLLKTNLATVDFKKAYSISWKIGLYLLKQGRHAMALDIFNDLRQTEESRQPKAKEDLVMLSSIYNVIGAIYEETGLWNDAISMYMNSLKACNESNNLAGKAKVYNNIGQLYFSRNELKKAEELYKQAIEINTRLNIKPELFNNYNNLAGVYNLKHDARKALEYALIALNQLDINADYYDLSIVYSNIGNLYQEMGNYNVALSYYQQAAGIQSRESFQIAMTDSFLSISSLYQALKMADSASAFMLKCIDLVEKAGNPSQKLRVYRSAAKYFNKMQQYKQANDLYSKFVMLNDSLEALNSLTKIEQLQAVYEVINKEKDNKILQQKIAMQQLALQRQRVILVAAVLIFAFACYFLLYLVRSNRRERKNNSLILRQSELLHNQEKQKMIDQEQSLQLELDYKNRQLTSYALLLVRNNEFVQKTTEELKEVLLTLNSRDKERANRIKTMISDLHQYSSGNVWEEFRLYFAEVHQSFDRNLSTAYPDLSPKDKKICALLKLGLSTKDIASITFRELRSVESARNRLRKKLNLAPDVNIQSFLSQF